MTLLIIGGTGVLSTAVTAEALKQGFSVTMINRGNRTIPDGIEHIKADKDDLQTIAKVLEGRTFGAVMDFLCYTDAQTEKSVRFYMKYTKQYFYISSCAVYDTASLKGQLADEDSKKVLPIWSYSVNKWASEEKLKALLSGSNVHYTIIRPCVTYDDTRIPYGIMPAYGYHWTLCARITSGKPIITWNKGQNRCNMTRVEDFAQGVVGLVGNQHAFSKAFNVCGDETPSFKEVLDVVKDYLHKDIITVDVDSDYYAKLLPAKAGEIRGGRSIDSLNSNKNLCAVVPSFKQTIRLKEGVTKTLKCYEENNYEKGIDWEFDGDTDRIIAKWCKKKGVDQKSYQLGFVDYLGTASLNDKIKYYEGRYRDCSIVKLFLLCKKISNRIKRTI